MKIKECTYSNGRNDFKAIFTCPLCDYEYEAWGYSDDNFYDRVMPNAICPKCGKNEKGENEETLRAKLGHTVRLRVGMNL